MNISALLGKILTAITGKVGDDEIRFTDSEGRHYRLFHYQDCCENVRVEDICGNLEDLIGSPILQAEETTSNDILEGSTEWQGESFTWTFYKLATIKGYVTIRWYGESNGYYSESVDFEMVKED